MRKSNEISFESLIKFRTGIFLRWFFISSSSLIILFLLSQCAEERQDNIGDSATNTSSAVESGGVIAQQADSSVISTGGSGKSGVAGGSGSSQSIPTGTGGVAGISNQPNAGSEDPPSPNAGSGDPSWDAGPPPRDSAIEPSSDATQNDVGPAPEAGKLPETGTLPPVTDLAAAGPFQATDRRCGPANAYTCYYPAELAKDGVKNPFITWGNGAMTVPQWYTLLPHLASHGFVVIAANNSYVTAQDLTSGLDWLFAENDRADSEFYQKLDTTNVASMGYSLGSVGTFEIAADPRLKTTVHISGGAFERQAVLNLRNPAAFFCGNDSDIAHANCDLDFEGAQVPVFYGVFPGDHLGILGLFATPISEVVTGWLRWQLAADESLKSMFVGSTCALCADPGWIVQQKNLN